MRGSPASHRRWWLWLPALALAGWLALFGDKSPQGKAATVAAAARSVPVGEGPARNVAAPARSATASEPERIELLVQREQWFAPAPAEGAPAARPNLFSKRDWNPPPATAASAPQPPPVAPPLPFTFIGKKLEGQAWEVYLSRGEHSFIAREGQTIDRLYRVDRVAPPALTLTYLPLGQTQTLAIGDSR